jgi:hypothetical protein
MRYLHLYGRLQFAVEISALILKTPGLSMSRGDIFPRTVESGLTALGDFFARTVESDLSVFRGDIFPRTVEPVRR